MQQHFFVYGTLAPGRPNDHILADVTGTWTPATVSGTLLEQGWGAAHGYPGIVLAGSDSAVEAGEVEGLVLSSEELADHWDRLDEFEGAEYQRVTVRARFEDGSTVPAQIYALRT